MRIRFFVLLTCLLFSSEYKASISLDSNMAILCAQRKFFLGKAESMMKIPLPFTLKIKFKTPYIFDLDFLQNFNVAFGRNGTMGQETNVRKSHFYNSGRYDCKNEYTSFISHSILKVSKRKMIKRIYERVVFCFNFSIPLLFVDVVPLTRDGASFKFFHVPECEKGEDECKRGRPFVFSSFPSFFTYWMKYSSYWFAPFCGSKGEMIISNLYPFACLFSFSFDILVCSYLSCGIKIPFDIVFFFFFLPFTYLTLNKECKNEKKEKIKGNNDVDTSSKSDKKEEKLQSIIPLAVNKILSLFSFSIGIFDEEGIEE